MAEQGDDKDKRGDGEREEGVEDKGDAQVVGEKAGHELSTDEGASERAVSGSDGVVSGTLPMHRFSTHSLQTTAPPSTTLLPPMDIPRAKPTEEAIAHVSSLHTPESPTTALLSAFRAQIATLSDQSTALNAKLIQALSSRADLEDSNIALQAEHDSLRAQARALQEEKEKWEENMKSGLLVERAQISSEMQKLAAGLVEEERRRGSAEERRQQVENEVDDLAATLFDQVRSSLSGRTGMGQVPLQC